MTTKRQSRAIEHPYRYGSIQKTDRASGTRYLVRISLPTPGGTDNRLQRSQTYPSRDEAMTALREWNEERGAQAKMTRGRAVPKRARRHYRLFICHSSVAIKRIQAIMPETTTQALAAAQRFTNKLILYDDPVVCEFDCEAEFAVMHAEPIVRAFKPIGLLNLLLRDEGLKVLLIAQKCLGDDHWRNAQGDVIE